MTEHPKPGSIKDQAVRNIKSNLFAYVFSEEKALAELYQMVGREIAAEDIVYLDLDSLLQRTGRYNDTSFRTSDYRLIAFFEHQSTPSANMPIRFLEYAVDTIRVLRVQSERKEGQSRFDQKLKTIKPKEIPLTKHIIWQLQKA